MRIPRINWAVWACWALAGPAIAQQIVVYHQTATVEIGTSRQFTAYVPLAPAAVLWSVNGIAGGNTAVGTVSNTGLYQAPAAAPTPSMVRIRATSTAYPEKYGESVVTLIRPAPWIWSVSPSPIPSGNFDIRLNGANYKPDAQVRLNGMPLMTTYLSPTSLRAAGSAAPGKADLTVYLPGPGEVTSQPLSITFGEAAPVTVSPASVTVAAGGTTAFTSNMPVTWSATSGTITAAGVFTAPSTAQTVTVRAASAADPSRFATAAVTVTQPALSITPATATVAAGGTVSFAATLPVVWSASAGTITAAGLFTAPATAQTVTIRATGTAGGQSAAATVTVTGPEPTVSRVTAGRLLEQAGFGPRPADIARVQALGVEGWIDEQLTLPETAIPDQSSTAALRAWQLHTLAHAPDQLRQRVSYALSQMIVTSLNKLNYPNEILPWMRVLQRNAFGNYRTLLRETTISPSMGKYLDLANSTKPTATSGANENYPREVMQLFSIGLWRLNPDGSQLLDSNGEPVPAYDQATVRQVALALTGWTYPTAPGGQANGLNWENFSGDMEPRPAYHDTSAKAFLGCALPPNQTIQQDLDATIDCLTQHPNTAPFVATRLIRSLVKSNPSPAYIARVAGVFGNNGQGVRGDLRAVVRAILTDAEAREDTPGPGSGRLKEPLYFVTALIRALDGSIAPDSGISYIYDNMGQSVLAAPSVFGWYSPLYRVPKGTLYGPEFQIYTPTEATLRANFVYQILTANGGEISVDLSNFQAVAGNTGALLDEIDRVFFYGRMPAGVRGAIGAAITASYDNKQRVQAAVYLATLSGQYAVQF
ncbi:MAG TPA: DUF1800 family protein [Bryobacteraceae bacterium]|nr:DUF1800 family protein [Bryobacteraceae bacterium]